MRFKYLLLAMFTIIVWGISLPVTTILLNSGFTPNLITFSRFFVAAVIMTFAFPKRKNEKIKKNDRLPFYLMGLGGTTLFFYFENTALKFTSVSNTALITATIPLFTLLVAAIVYKKKILWQNLMGIPLGLGGTALLFYKDIMHSSINFKGDLFVLGSVIMWVVYSFSYRKVADKYTSAFIVYKTFIFGSIFAFPLALMEYNSFILIQLNYNSIFALLFLAVLCSYLGYYLWTLALKNVGIKITSNLILFIPIISIITDIVMLGSKFTWMLLGSTVFIILGAYLVSINDENSHF